MPTRLCDHCTEVIEGQPILVFERAFKTERAMKKLIYTVHRECVPFINDEIDEDIAYEGSNEEIPPECLGR